MSFRTVLLSAATSGSSAPQDCLTHETRDFTVYLTGTGTISGGTLVIEEASYSVTSGPIVVPPSTWSQIPMVAIDCTEVTGGATKAWQLPPGAYHFVRVRIVNAITGGGTLTAQLIGV